MSKDRGYSPRAITGGRIVKITVAFALFLIYLVYNLFSLQFINYAYYQNKVYDQITTSSAMKAKRGNIYDSNMNLLATDKTVWRIFVSSREIKKQEKETRADLTSLISDGLSEILALNRDTVYKKISNSNVLDITIKKTATEDEYKKILEFAKKENLERLVFCEAQVSRYYPEQTLAAHVLGFVGSDLQGLYGLEYYYDKELSGKDGYYLYAKDANGNALPSEYATYVPAEPGCSLVTTIESYVQAELESQLETIRINHGVQNRVTGIVMDTRTGAILAMATSGAFNPNSPYELDTLSAIKLQNSGFAEGSEEYKSYKKSLLEQMWANKAVSETYEPGSTFKIVTVASALDSGAAKESDCFSCHGYLQVGGWRIKCHKVNGHGSGFSLAYGLQMSCNPTMMTIAQRMGAQTFYKYVESFGYFEKTGIDLPSEASTIFHELENIGTTELATTSFGQRFKVSVIRQLVSACAVANGGELVTPYLVEKIIDSEGNVISEHETGSGGRAVSKDVADAVAKMLEAGVSGDGGAKNARVDGYKIAAKTGTSEKFDVLDANGNSYLRIGSTVAFSMSDDGGIGVIIVVDEPTSNVKYGSVVAAPYVSSLLEKSLPYLDYLSESESVHTAVESYIGMSVADACAKIKMLGLAYEVVGKGKTVIAQTPGENQTLLAESGRIILYTTDPDRLYIEVPNVVGMKISDANATLINAGFNLRINGITDTTGYATVISQSLTPNSVVPKNSVIELNIIYTDFED